jgi:hypothetical protein
MRNKPRDGTLPQRGRLPSDHPQQHCPRARENSARRWPLWAAVGRTTVGPAVVVAMGVGIAARAGAAACPGARRTQS